MDWVRAKVAEYLLSSGINNGFYYAFKLKSSSCLQHLILCTEDNGIIIISNP